MVVRILWNCSVCFLFHHLLHWNPVHPIFSEVFLLFHIQHIFAGDLCFPDLVLHYFQKWAFVVQAGLSFFSEVFLPFHIQHICAEYFFHHQVVRHCCQRWVSFGAFYPGPAFPLRLSFAVSLPVRSRHIFSERYGVIGTGANGFV